MVCNRRGNMLTNRRRVALAIVTACATFGLYIGGAAAQAVTVTITVDENCRGTLVSSVGQSGPVPCSRIPDPGPGGLAGAMTYALPGGPTLTRIELGAEGNNGFVYTPISGQPGFVTVTGGPAIIATYVIKSDVVPEPG